MNKKVLIAAMAAVMALMGSCDSPDTAKTSNSDSTVRISINTEKTYQKMEGFGASGGWWSQDVGSWKELDPILDLLFDSKKGIGLTIYRYNIGAGPQYKVDDPWRRAETFEVSPGKYDWSRDANAVKAMKGAVMRGVDNVIMFANSPPGRMTKNGYTSGDFNGLPNFKAGMEADFAKYLVDIAEHFKGEGIPVKYVSPINEPQWEWKAGQEGCRYETDEVMKVSRAFVRELKKRNSDIKPSFDESGKWFDPNYTVKLYHLMVSDPEIGPAMDHFAAHSYWSSESDKKVVAGLLDKEPVKLPLHMSEWCQMESGRDLGMDAALVLARTVYEDLSILSVSSWQHWLAVSSYDYKDGLVYVDKDTRKYYDSKRMWALGNWSRYVRPGFIRVGASCEDGNLLTTAFKSPDGKKMVVVVINPGTETSVKFDNVKYSRVSCYETSDSKSLEEVFQGSAKKDMQITARSIITFVFE